MVLILDRPKTDLRSSIRYFNRIPATASEIDKLILSITLKTFDLAFLRIRAENEEFFFVVDPLTAFDLPCNIKTAEPICIVAKGEHTNELPGEFVSKSFPIASLNDTLPFQSIKFQTNAGAIYFVENKNGQLTLFAQKSIKVSKLNELVPMANIPMLSILGNPKYPIFGRLFEILQLALDKKDDIDFEIFNGLKTVPILVYEIFILLYFQAAEYSNHTCK